MKHICDRQEIHTEILAKEPDGKRTLPISKLRWEDDIKNNDKNKE
jgi:hypothetical protein